MAGNGASAVVSCARAAIDAAWVVETIEVREFGLTLSPLGRLGTPRDVADVVAFLVRDQGHWIIGGNLQAGGGVAMM